MNNIDEINNELLEECCRMCVDLYNELLGENFEYDEVFYLKGLRAQSASLQEKVDEVRKLVMELELCGIFDEDEADEVKFARKNELEKFKYRLSHFRS